MIAGIIEFLLGIFLGFFVRPLLIIVGNVLGKPKLLALMESKQSHRRQKDPKISEENFFMNKDGLKIFMREWIPSNPSKIKATVFLVHGAAEHSGRYAELAQSLNAQNISVFALDLVGHGNSEGDRCFATSVDDYVEDILKWMNFVVESKKNLVSNNRFLFGHSYGGKLSLITLTKKDKLPANIKGVILSAPAIYSAELLQKPIVRAIISSLSKALPKLPSIAVDNTALSHDPNVAVRISNDPIHYKGALPIKGVEVFVVSGDVALECAPKFDWPVFIVHGEKDSVIPLDLGGRLVYNRIASQQKVLKIFKGMFHEVHNEPEAKQELFKDIADFIENN